MDVFGIETLRPNGSVAMSGANKAGIFVEVVTLYYYDPQPGSKVFLDIPAGCMFVVTAAAGGEYTFHIGDDGLGHAKLSWTSNGPQNMSPSQYTIWVVFATRTLSPDSFGVSTLNNDGDQLTDYNHPVPQFAATLQPPAAPTQSWYATDTGYQLNMHKTSVNARPGTNRLLAIYLPDSTVNDAWYCCQNMFLKAGETVYDGSRGGYITDLPITIYALRNKNNGNHPEYEVPTIHAFSLDGATSGGGTFGMQYLKPNGDLVYDSSAENVSVAYQATMGRYPQNYPSSTPAQSITIPNMPAKAAVVMPYYERHLLWGREVDMNGYDADLYTFRGFFQRKGNTLNYAEICCQIDRAHQSDMFVTYELGAANFLMVIDASQLGAGSVTGTPYWIY